MITFELLGFNGFWESDLVLGTRCDMIVAVFEHGEHGEYGDLLDAQAGWIGLDSFLLFFFFFFWFFFFFSVFFWIIILPFHSSSLLFFSLVVTSLLSHF